MKREEQAEVAYVHYFLHGKYLFPIQRLPEGSSLVLFTKLLILLYTGGDAAAGDPGSTRGQRSLDKHQYCLARTGKLFFTQEIMFSREGNAVWTSTNTAARTHTPSIFFL
jgi:hypothetical protein